MAQPIPSPLIPPSQPDPKLPMSYATPPMSYGVPGVDTGPIADFLSPATSSAPPITNTTVATSADAANPVAANNIAMPIGYMPKNLYAQQSTAANKPTDYLSPEARKTLGYGNAALGGIAAGGQVAPTADAGDAALQVAGSTIGGAAAGFVAGGPVGGAIGGIAGLVAGGLNAFVGTHAARAAARKEDKIRRDIQARDEARYQQARADEQKYFDINRGDTLEKERYNRKMAAVQSQWAAQERSRSALNDVIAQDASIKHMLIGEMR